MQILKVEVTGGSHCATMRGPLLCAARGSRTSGLERILLSFRNEEAGRPRGCSFDYLSFDFVYGKSLGEAGKMRERLCFRSVGVGLKNGRLSGGKLG